MSKRYTQTGVGTPLEHGKGGPKTHSGTGSPEGSVTGNVGDTYRRTDGGADTTFYVKESGTGNTGWTAYGAAGGSAKRKWVTNHGFNQTSISENFIPINDLAESTAGDYYQKMLCPLNCKVTKVVVWPTSALCGNTDINCYRPDKPDSGSVDTLLKSVTVNMNANQAWEFDFSGDPPLWNANELAMFGIAPTGDGPDQCIVQIHWEEQ